MAQILPTLSGMKHRGRRLCHAVLRARRSEVAGPGGAVSGGSQEAAVELWAWAAAV